MEFRRDVYLECSKIDPNADIDGAFQIRLEQTQKAATPDVGDVLTLAQPRTDDPLSGVSVPTSTVANPVAGTPSHIQQTYAQLVSALPVNDTQGQTHSGMPALSTEQDYHDYISSRSAAWTAARTHARW